jgi:hypothetical protein
MSGRIVPPEPLRSLVRDSRRGEATTFGIWGGLLTLGAGGFCLYLAYYVLHRASIYGELRVRGEEWIAAIVGLVLFGVGLLLAAVAWQSATEKDDAGPLGDPATRIVGVRRVVNNAGRWLAIRLEGGGELRLKFRALVPDENAEIAALEAVERLPQWKGPPPHARASALSSGRALAAVREQIAALPGPADGKRTALDGTWAQIAHAMRTAGLTLTSHVEEGVTLDPTPKSPIRADFTTRGARAFYFRKPETGLQTLQVVGDAAPEVFNDILNIGYVPVLHAKIPTMLESGDRAAILRALGAIEFVHAGQPGNYYRAQLTALAVNADPEIRAAAIRAGGVPSAS